MGDFDGAGNKPGLEIWRIEKLVPVAVDKKMHGKFYDGDSYICLKTKQRPGSSSFEWDIFFWLGAESSQDEQGVAAYKTVELDEHLGGAPVQHREVQGFESDQFMQCFKSVEYMKGGVASGFKQVVRDSYETRLLHLKGARIVRVATVPLSAGSLNAGDVFVLDMGKEIIQWNGSGANRKEKAKALEVCQGIKDDERGGKARITACDQGSEPEAFWKGLGGQGAVAAATSDDSAAVAKTAAKLIKVSDASGSLEKTEVGSGELSRDMLDTKDVFLMDNGAEISVWVGRGATQDERKAGMKIAQQYCSESDRPKGTKVVKVMEGTEPTTFKSNFKQWESAALPSMFRPGEGGGNVAKVEEKSGAELVSGMMAGVAAGEQPDLGPGGTPISTEVWRIEDFKEVPLDPSMYGQFYAGDSYIVKHTYKLGSKEGYYIYFWQGAQSSTDEKGASALIATRMDDELGGAATQVRVVMGKEPAHFISLFKGKMCVHSGGKASGFKNKEDADSYDQDGVSLFHVKGQDSISTRAVQVAEQASSLNSGDCFVLLTPGTMFVWKGEYANEAEADTANQIATNLQAGRGLEQVAEGGEPDGFWSAIGGKGDYPREKPPREGSREPMLFHCSNATGRFEIEAIYDFAQGDLEEDDVFLLDTYSSVYIWIGSAANEAEKRQAHEMAGQYIQANGYGEDTTVLSVKSGSEPPTFTCYFLGWDASQNKKFLDPYEAKLAAIAAANPPEEEEAPPPPEPAAPAITMPVAKPGESIPYAQLKEMKEGIDPSKKETYLGDDEFEKVLGSPRSEFAQMKAWKQNQLKKAAGLF